MPPAAYTYAIDREVAEQAPRAPVRIPRHLAPVRLARRPRVPRPPGRGAQHDRAAPRQRRVGVRGRRRPLGRDEHGDDAARGPRDGHALGRHRSRRCCSTSQRRAGLDVDGVDDLLNKRSGILGLGGHGDMRDLVAAAESGDARATLALEVYAHRIRSYVGAYAAPARAGRRDRVHGRRRRERGRGARRSLAGLEAFGVEVDAERNRRAGERARRISTDASRTRCSSCPRTRSSRSRGRRSRSWLADPIRSAARPARPARPLRRIWSTARVRLDRGAGSYPCARHRARAARGSARAARSRCRASRSAGLEAADGDLRPQRSRTLRRCRRRCARVRGRCRRARARRRAARRCAATTPAHGGAVGVVLIVDGPVGARIAHGR